MKEQEVSIPEALTAQQAADALHVEILSFKAMSAQRVCPQPKWRLGKNRLWDKKELLTWHENRPGRSRTRQPRFERREPEIHPKYVSITEAALITGEKRDTLAAYERRGEMGLPQPVGKVGISRIWLREDFENWGEMRRAKRAARAAKA